MRKKWNEPFLLEVGTMYTLTPDLENADSVHAEVDNFWVYDPGTHKKFPEETQTIIEIGLRVVEQDIDRGNKEEFARLIEELSKRGWQL